jgi:hypothetical protein
VFSGTCVSRRDELRSRKISFQEFVGEQQIARVVAIKEIITT